MCTVLARAVSPTVRATGVLPRTRARTLRVNAMAAKYEIAVKGDPKNSVLGDCPFCHRALLTLEEKGVPYSKTYINLDAKPQWLLDANPSGTVPVIREVGSDKWIPDSGVIVDLLEEKFPDPKLGTAESAPQVGGGVFGAFKDFLKAPKGQDTELEQKLLKELEELEAYLSKGGPFIGGAAVTATDLSLMPKLYHLEVALKYFKGWALPSHFAAVRKYIDTFEARPSWKNTYYAPELVIAGWERHGVHKQ